MYFNLPNLLTFSRIGAIPVLLLLFMIPGDAGRWAACVVFTIAAVTRAESTTISATLTTLAAIFARKTFLTRRTSAFTRTTTFATAATEQYAPVSRRDRDGLLLLLMLLLLLLLLLLLGESQMLQKSAKKTVIHSPRSIEPRVRDTAANQPNRIISPGVPTMYSFYIFTRKAQGPSTQGRSRLCVASVARVSLIAVLL